MSIQKVAPTELVSCFILICYHKVAPTALKFEIIELYKKN